MNDRANVLIAATAEALCGRHYTYAEMHTALFNLVRLIVDPATRELSPPPRYRPLAGEVLPRHQRAAWAQGKTSYDEE